MTLRSGFDHELDVLKSNITDMGIQVEHSYNNLFRAIALREENVIHEILKNNRYISDMERNIESRCLSIITRQQPVAKDLRTVSAILKVVTDMERIGDYVIDIAELSTLVFYESFQHEVMSELRTYAHILERMDLEAQKKQEVYDSVADQLRITLIEKAGEVVYDSNMDIAAMDKHGSRPEVERAFQTDGKAIRRSDTINKTAFYYALRLEDGSVLRVAKEAKSIFHVFGTMAPVLGGIMVLLFLLCLLLAHFLTKSMVRPIEQISENMEDLSSIETYQELMPFICMIQAQHDDIMKNARLRQDFTANVSHELKTPLTSISGYSELIENGMAT